MRATVVVFLLVAVPIRLEAQQSRAELIEQAVEAFDASQAIRSLGAAADPSAGPLDSLWAVSVHQMAQTLFDEGDVELAHAWLRWAAWLAPESAIDSVLYYPEVVDAHSEARLATRDRMSPADSIALTSWEWPDTVDNRQLGHVRFESPGDVEFRIEIDGRTIEQDQSIDLLPGTYGMIAVAEAYDEVRTEREVLPGVTTVVSLSPAPRLREGTREFVTSALVRVTTLGADLPACQPGFVAAADGLVLTSYGALERANQVDVAGPGAGEPLNNVRVAAFDSSLNMAVLALGASRARFISPALEPAAGSYAWSMYLDGCEGSEVVSRTRLRGQEGPGPQRSLDFDAVTVALPGAVLVDRLGRLLGFVTGTGSAVPLDQIQALLERARAPIVVELPEDEVAQVAGGGAPWKLIAGGAGAVGALVALLAGGDGGTADPPTTGEVVVNWPGS